MGGWAVGRLGGWGSTTAKDISRRMMSFQGEGAARLVRYPKNKIIFNEDYPGDDGAFLCVA